MKPLRLRTALTLAYVGVLAVTLAAIGVAFHVALVRQLDTDATTALQDKAEALHGYLQFVSGVPALAYDRSDPEETAFINDATAYYQVYDAGTGRLLTQSPALEALGLHYTPAEVADLQAGPQIHDVETDKGRLRLTSTVISPRPGEAYLVEVGEPLTFANRTLAGFDLTLAWIVLSGIGVAALLGSWFAGRALTPLTELAAQTRTVGVANLNERVGARGAGDELDLLASDFNHMLGRLETSVEDMRQFSTALAHELRTPIAILRGEAERELSHPLSADARQERVLSQIEEYDRLTRLITQILTLARAEAGEIKLLSQPVDLGALAAAVSEQIEPVASARNIALTCEATAGAWLMGDAGWIERLILILLDNAIKFTPDDGRVVVAVARSGNQVSVTVSDTGVGIAPDEIRHLFRRFYRTQATSAQRTPGFGLGLALAKWIADRHSGNLQATSEPGAGAVFTATFPASQPPVEINKS